MRVIILYFLSCCCIHVFAKEALALFSGPSVQGEIVFADDTGGTTLTISLRLAGNESEAIQKHAVRVHQSYVTEDVSGPLSTRCNSAGDVLLFNETDSNWTALELDLSPSQSNFKWKTKAFTVSQVVGNASIVVYVAGTDSERLGCANIISRRATPLAEIPTADWWPSLWILLGICVTCVIVERAYNSCRKVIRKRQGRSVEGFSQVPVVGFETSKSYDNTSAFEIEMADADDDAMLSDDEHHNLNKHRARDD